MPSRGASHRLQKGVSGGFRLGGEPESLARFLIDASPLYLRIVVQVDLCWN
jgi:hypothetical protein